MRPSKFVATAERQLGRALTIAEADAVCSARHLARGGKRVTVKAMRHALALIQTPAIAIN